MEFQREMMGFVLVLVCFLGSSQAYTFHVGGKDGWALKPSEGYSHWAQRNRFQVNDTLIFKYNKGSDSVLIVKKNDYYNCNKAKPIQSLSGGDSVYKIDRSGPIFFISGEAENCNKGQKLEIIVLAVRNNTTHKAPSPTPSTLSPSPAANPAAASPDVVESPKAESPNIETSPEPAPSTVVQAPAPAPSTAAGVGGGSVGLVMGLSLVLGLVSGLV
ncbi:early nodulin-like protein 3 [Rhododendron vialii]|uniref:early nodulin-like protein 3 n=1 Tax=Rhododendron vialii TaxID=182163 RepID=UPI00265FDC0E|nr:early nodulin-like protein 3 [Rhododendron vialii]